ncbi:hypothetical protein [Leptospira sarikeiensis]|uniref:Uncharacterized protein n=1 Tax=Leptospira sarikeiensis TaxID=2484943 RepID=A0A4V6QM51_9LEPT|nr:hypothetical protein [Leptospira sarikeiensis]TGL58925.1 hypothetical protein EHQ64_17965 [Leptospira sarikeiensis]
MAQFLLIAALALGSSSAFANEASDVDASEQFMSEAQESISEELKSIYQEEVDQILSEGISYSEEERNSDFPDLDSLLTDDHSGSRIAKSSGPKKTERENISLSGVNRKDQRIGIEKNANSIWAAFGCLAGSENLLSLRNFIEQNGGGFLPLKSSKNDEVQKSDMARGLGYQSRNFIISVSCGLENLATWAMGQHWVEGDSLENDQKLDFLAGVPAIQLSQVEFSAYGKSKLRTVHLGANTLERSAIHSVSSRLAKIGGVEEGGLSIILPRVSKVEGYSEQGDFAKFGRGISQEIGEASCSSGEYKFSSGRPTPEILT